MFIAEYSDRYDDYISIGRTKKEAIDSMIATLKENAYNCDTLLDDMTEEELRDQMDVYELTSGETVKTGYGIHYRDGKQIRK